MLSVLYGVSTSAINQHIKKIYEDKELEEKSTIKNFLIVQDKIYISDFDELLLKSKNIKDEK